MNRLNSKDDFSDNIKQWSNDEIAMFRNWLVSHLTMGPMTITFTKKDGDTRVMRCTLDPNQLPPVTEVRESKKKENLDTLSVFDLNKNEWRSFIIKNVKRVEFEL
jgi:hypothetical protein